MMQISVSGADSDDSIQVFLDDQKLAWKSNGLEDRSFYIWRNETAGLEAGNHTLLFKPGSTVLKKAKMAPILQLCSVTLHEYSSDYPHDFEAISAYPTYSEDGVKYLRPTDESCLMRNMTRTSFCPICKESLWQQLLMRIRWIDDLEVLWEGSKVQVTLNVVGEGKLPTTTITWEKDGKLVPEFQDLTTWTRKLEEGVVEDWTVYIQFTSPEIRKSFGGVTEDRMHFVLTGKEWVH